MLKDILAPSPEGTINNEFYNSVLSSAALQLLELDKESLEKFKPYIAEDFFAKLKSGLVAIDYPGIPFTCLIKPYQYKNWLIGPMVDSYKDDIFFILLRVIRQGRKGPYLGRTLDLCQKKGKERNGARTGDPICNNICGTVFLPKDNVDNPVLLDKDNRESLGIELLDALHPYYSGTMWSSYLTSLPTVCPQ